MLKPMKLSTPTMNFLGLKKAKRSTAAPDTVNLKVILLQLLCPLTDNIG